ncbi:hypothetical protein ACFQLX_21815 [Streptomyces polyrhachis]|uniref:Antitoxin n=1 Tax=Streptomyces polyrhachis TaxID=1282885 RepID=A0ABW2GMN2_9ACTN
MTADPRIRTAADGVQEVALTDARAVLSRLIEDAREGGRVSALTVRGRRRICLVTPEFYAEALRLMDERSG